MMTQNAISRPNSTIIGGEDWSAYVLNFAPIRGGLERDGVVSVTGTLEIGLHDDNPSSLDPLLNASLWKRSQTVRLEIANDSGTLIDHPFGYLFILRVPILSPDGRLLTVEVGDYLALANKREVPGDESGITLGTAVDLSVVCQSYLEAAGIPTSNIALGGPWGYEVALPIPKDNVNALAMAGRIAYASNFRVLYQNHDGVINAHQVTVTAGTPALSFNAANIPNDWFERAFEPATAPEIVKVVGTGETVTQISTPITETVSETGLEVFTSSSYSFSVLTEYIFGNVTINIPEDAVAVRIERRRERQDEDTVFGNGSSILVTTDDTTERYFYEWVDGVDSTYRLILRISDSEKAVGIIDGGESSITETYKLEVEGWSYDADGVMTDHNVATYARQKQYAPNDNLPLQWRLVEDFDEEWIEESTDTYKYRSRTRVAAITQDQSIGTSNASNKWALRAIASENRPAKKQGDNSPPAADLWEGPWDIAENNYEGEATYTPPGGTSAIPPEEVIELPESLGISNAVCASMAAKWAQILGGKEYKMNLTLPITDALLAIDSPLFQVAYTVDGRVRTYLVDNQGFIHTSDTSLCEAVGILIEDVAA
jgi:hypothetical protein